MKNKLPKKDKIIIGITGGSGSGTSEVGRILQEFGFLFLDSDKIYHTLLAQDKVLIENITSRFGKEIISADKINRDMLADIVFNDKKALKDLNSITHNAISQAIVNIIIASTKRYVAIEAIALYESPLYKLCDIVLFVTADYQTRLSRIIYRDKISIERASVRLASQREDDYFSEHSHYTIENNGSIAELRSKVEEFLKFINSKYKF